MNESSNLLPSVSAFKSPQKTIKSTATNKKHRKAGHIVGSCVLHVRLGCYNDSLTTISCHQKGLADILLNYSL